MTYMSIYFGVEWEFLHLNRINKYFGFCCPFKNNELK